MTGRNRQVLHTPQGLLNLLVGQHRLRQGRHTLPACLLLKLYRIQLKKNSTQRKSLKTRKKLMLRFQLMGSNLFLSLIKKWVGAMLEKVRMYVVLLVVNKEEDPDNPH